ncbi:unnamed protein product [Cuscuta epithymum]|uniref:COP1-interacting protein 7 n=1 Tax=Cuscuta epithymum TaxID=186058 RepID=A0AAV0E6X0_9ASTE|nr:unnamed protein product [Cuscuta epithymum]
MKSSTQLDSVVFRLTPTRTRCDLIIIANGKKEKIASGLLNPFLAHMKSAQEKIAKGGYSIILEPPQSQSMISWFTKGTVERFVRFVNTPDILERVYIIESEIIQIEETIAIQGKNDIQHCLVEDQQTKAFRDCDGSKSEVVSNGNKAVVLYKPEEHIPQASGSFSQDGNCRVQILKILQSRKSVLEKEQCMAFERAAAAGFHFDDMPFLLSFGKCFGASRLRDACFRFMELWKKKHEFGQPLETGAAEVVAGQTDLFDKKASYSNEKLNTDCIAGQRAPMDAHLPKGQHENPQGQFPIWSMYSPSSAPPPLQPYYVQRLPYHHTYLQNNPLYPPYGVEDAQVGVMQRNGPKIQLTDKKCSNNEVKIEAPRSFKAKVSNPNSYDEREVNKPEIDGGYWLAFQNILFKESGEDNYTEKGHMPAKGKYVRIQKDPTGDDHTTLGGKGADDLQDSRDNVIHRVSIDMSCCIPSGSSDGVLHSIRECGNILGHDDQIDLQYAETNGGKVYAETVSHDSTLAGWEHFSGSRNSINTLTEKGLQSVTNILDKASSQYMADESFIVPVRSMLFNVAVPEIITHCDCELSTAIRNTESNFIGVRSQVNYKRSNLDLIPKCVSEENCRRYNPTLDYEMKAHVKDNISQEKGKKKASSIVKEVNTKMDKDQRGKADLDNKNTVGPIRRGKLSMTSPVHYARVHAERLRAFKEDTQKMKMEKEEADIKCLEALNLERHKRIAARGSYTSADLVVPLSQRRQQPINPSPSPIRGSKFSDLEPGSSSPLQRSKIRNPLVSTISPKDSKSHKFSDGQSNNNRLTKSASSWSDPNKKSSNIVTPDSKASTTRVRKLSEPKTVNWPVASVKAHSSETLIRLRKSKEPENTKISEVIDLDATQAATLPELKIRSPKGLSDNMNVSGPPINSANVKSMVNGEKAPCDSAGDENIVEKTVVMLECEISSLPVAHASGEECRVLSQQCYSHGHLGEKISVVFEHAVPTDAPPSPFVGFVSDPIPGLDQGQLNSCEVGEKCAHETPKVAKAGPGGKPYEAPYAPMTSLAVSDLALAKPMKSLVESARTDGEYTIQDDSAKARVKEPPRGLWRLWKFGKKKHCPTACDKNLEPDQKSVNRLKHQDGHAANTTSSSEVYTLKNLMSRDETSAVDNAVQKSRHFSLLTNFWSRTSEKKLRS